MQLGTPLPFSSIHARSPGPADIGSLDALAPPLAELDRRIETVRSAVIDVRALLAELPLLQQALPLVGCAAWRSAAAEHYEARLDELVARVGLARSALEQAELELTATVLRLERERDDAALQLSLAGASAATPAPGGGWR
ncbi:hypothetical protein ROT00_07925 [Agromyces mediolanus]|uniref:hypothetical protein n=1 Tax=Agromyces mediolanus TaxID=41986 RepID=UPI0038379F51